ncbi:ABC transporter permease subunit [Microbacterium elymi]|uniref:ABC transporter permease subunit n=1 Tax=Microbacterium elymi TaxID=2909587 RepID=A0ABY5NHH0_9MICO|nr:ABC transporter permease subunit [Microbacterium elymi]UUT34598.1 ABC transporter permease subunit [Microbacterium elymi]
MILLIAGWQVFVMVSQVNPFVFPPPAAVGKAFLALILDPATWQEALVTVTEIVVGFAIAVVLGVAVGVVLGKLPWLEISIRPLIIIAQVAPKVAFIPMFVIWFGFGMTSKIVLSALLAFFPVMLNVLLGVRSVEQGQKEVMTSLNASRSQTFTQLELAQPAALPVRRDGGRDRARHHRRHRRRVPRRQRRARRDGGAGDELAGCRRDVRHHPAPGADRTGAVPDSERGQAVRDPVA